MQTRITMALALLLAVLVSFTGCNDRRSRHTTEPTGLGPTTIDCPTNPTKNVTPEECKGLLASEAKATIAKALASAAPSKPTTVVEEVKKVEVSRYDGDLVSCVQGKIPYAEGDSTFKKEFDEASKAVVEDRSATAGIRKAYFEAREMFDACEASMEIYSTVSVKDDNTLAAMFPKTTKQMNGTARVQVKAQRDSITLKYAYALANVVFYSGSFPNDPFYFSTLAYEISGDRASLSDELAKLLENEKQLDLNQVHKGLTGKTLGEQKRKGVQELMTLWRAPINKSDDSAKGKKVFIHNTLCYMEEGTLTQAQMNELKCDEPETEAALPAEASAPPSAAEKR